jgi:hypothetical protein
VATSSIQINRAPVMTLWAAIVAERLGHDHDAALTLGKMVAGLNAQKKGQRLGIYGKAGSKAAHSKSAGDLFAPKPRGDAIVLFGREVPVTRTAEGIRAVEKDKPVDPRAVERYLEQKFGDALPDATAALRSLARAHSPERLSECCFGLYEEFRPAIPKGQVGWGAKGTLDLDVVREMAARAK